jgi:hypothetical protein
MVVAQGFECPKCKLIQQFGFESKSKYLCKCETGNKEIDMIDDVEKKEIDEFKKPLPDIPLTEEEQAAADSMSRVSAVLDKAAAGDEEAVAKATSLVAGERGGGADMTLSDAEQQRVDGAKKIAENYEKQAIKIVRGLEKVAKSLPMLPNDKKGQLLPPVGLPFKMNGLFYFVVSYQNVGKMRISCDYLGLTPNPDLPGVTFENSQERIILKDGTEVTRLEFEKWRRDNYPTEQEKGRNPANATLGVQPGVMGGGADFKQPK